MIDPTIPDLPQGQEPQDPQRPKTSVDSYRQQIRQRALERPVIGTTQAQQMLEQQTNENMVLLETLRRAALKNPELAAEAQRASIELGDISPELAARNIDRVRQLLNERRWKIQANQELPPILRDHLARQPFADVASDEIERMSGWERVVAKWRGGRLTVRRGEIGENVKWRIASPDQVQELVRLGEELRAMPETGNIFEGAAQTAGQLWEMLPDTLIGAGAGALTGAGIALAAGQAGPQMAAPEELLTVPLGALKGAGWGFTVASMWKTYEIESGNFYLDMVEAGYDEGLATEVSTGVGIVNSLIEVLPIMKVGGVFTDEIKAKLTAGAVRGLMRPTAVRAGRRWLTGTGESFVAENVAELGQEISNILGEALIRTLEGKPTQSWDEIGEQLGAIARESAYGMFIPSMVGPTFRYLGDRKRAANAKRDIAYFERAMERGLDGSKVADRKAPSARQFFHDALVGGGDTMFVDAEDFLQAMNKAEVTREQLREKLPGVDAQLERALETGDSMTIPTMDFRDELAGTPLGDALKPAVRFDEDGMSVGQADQFLKLEEQFAEKANEAELADKAFRESARRVEEDMLSQVRSIGKLGDPDARAVSKFYRAFVSSMASNLGVSPEEFHKERGLTFIRGDDKDALYDQEGQIRTESPAFKSWFRVSQAVDEKGAPLKLYHGTKAQFGRPEFGSGVSFPSPQETGEFQLHLGTTGQSNMFVEGHAGPQQTTSHMVRQKLFDRFRVRHQADLKSWYITDTESGSQVASGVGQDTLAATFDSLVEREAQRIMADPALTREFVKDVPRHEGPRLFPVYIRAEKPFRMVDRSDWTAGQAIDQMREQGLITEEQQRELHLEHDGESTLGEFLESQGYDSVVYLNRYEVPNITSEESAKRAAKASTGSTMDIGDEEFRKLYPEAEEAWIVFSDDQVRSQLNKGGWSSFYEQHDYKPPTAKQRAKLRITPSLPTATKSRTPNVSEILLPMLELASQPVGAEAFTKNVELFNKKKHIVRKPNGKFVEVRGYDSIKVKGKTPKQRAESIINQMVRNLQTLFDAVPKDVVKRSRKWYEGAHKIANAFAERYGLTLEQAAGILAVLSPQADWRMNVSYAERILDAINHSSTEPFTAKMEQWLKDYTASRGTAAGKAKAAAMHQLIKGKKLGELTNPLQMAYWIRAFDETTNKKTFRDITPEGEFLDFVQKKPDKKGNVEATSLTWTSFDIMASAISVLQDGSLQSISDALGGAHKVRNFYNNILDPKAKLPFVTSDTHQVAANLLMPLGSGTAEVQHNLGTGRGSAKVAELGLSGTYWLYHEAVVRAAESRGVLPREMQSVSWEAVRALFSPEFKRDKEKVNQVRDIWKAHHNGKLTYEGAVSRIFSLAGGIDNPSWFSHRPGSGNAPAAGHSTYDGGVPADRLRGGQPGRARDGDQGASRGEAREAGAAELRHDEAADDGKLIRRGGFDPDEFVARINEAGDATTFLHEMAHYFLENYLELARQTDAPKQLRDDMAELFRWFGVDGFDAWDKLTQEEKARHHEAFAYSFEAYLEKNETPNEALRPLYRRFRDWLVAAYGSVVREVNAIYKRRFKRDLPFLTQEVQDVMGRMVAASEQVAQARRAESLVGIFESQEQSGMSDAEWSNYQAQLREAEQLAIEKMTVEQMKALAWVQAARARFVKAMQKEHKAERRRVREEVEQQLAHRPVYRALRFFRRGEHLHEDGTVTKHAVVKLNAAAARELLPEGVPASRLGFGRFGLVQKNGGLDPDSAADLLGFRTGRELVEAMVNAVPFKEAVEKETTERLVDSHLPDPHSAEGDLLIHRIIHNEAAARFIAIELRALARMQQPVRLMQRAARQAAERAVSKTKLSELQPHRHDQAAARAAKDAHLALAAGDRLRAVAAKRRQLLQTEMARIARQARDSKEKAEKLFRKVFESDVKIAKLRDIDLVNAARAILAHFGYGPPAGKPASSYLDQVKLYNPDAYDSMKSLLELAPLDEDQLANLTVEQFGILRHVVETLWGQSRAMRELEIQGEKVRVDDAVAELMQRADEQRKRKPRRGAQGSPTLWERALDGLFDMKAQLRKVENWIYSYDGDNFGPFQRLLFTPVRAALDTYRRISTGFVQRYVDLVATVDLKGGRIVAPELATEDAPDGFIFGRGRGRNGMAELLGALLHIGNGTGKGSNLRKLLVGRRWGMINEATGELDSSKWDQFVKRLVKEGVLTRRHFDFLQAVWDLNEEMKPAAQEAHRRLFGYYFKEVQAQEFTVTFPNGETVNYRGGYVPAKVDPNVVRDSQIHSKMEELEADWRAAMPDTGHGFTIDRNDNYARELSLDLRYQAKHIDDVLRFAYVQPAIRDVTKLLRRNELVDALNNRDPYVVDKMLIPWLNRAARQIVVEPGRVKWWDAFWKGARARVGRNIMFNNWRVALQQLTGWFPAMLKVPPHRLLGGLAFAAFRHGDMIKLFERRSGFMLDRIKNQSFDLHARLRDMVARPNAYQKSREWFAKHAYFAQVLMQNWVDVSTWMGAYNHHLAQLDAQTDPELAEREAARLADSAVRLTQGSFLPEDVATFEVGGAFYRTLTQFQTYFNMIANLQIDEFRAAARELGLPRKIGRFFLAHTLGFMAPMFVALLITEIMGGNLVDDEDDGYGDELLELFGRSYKEGALAMIPAAGPSINAAVNAYNDKPWDDRMLNSPTISTLEGMARTAKLVTYDMWLEDFDGMSSKQKRDFWNTLGMISGYPLGQVGKTSAYLEGVEEGRYEEPDSLLETIGGVLTGSGTRR